MASTQATLPYLSRSTTNQSSHANPNINANSNANGHANGSGSNGGGSNTTTTTNKAHRISLTSIPTSRSASQMSHMSRPSRSPQPPIAASNNRTSDPSSSKSKTSSLDSTAASSHNSSLPALKRQNTYPNPLPQRKLRSQYPRGSTENHVEYILVASFDIDRGPVMEHQFPVAITGDEHMLAELMLPDQAHARTQDWTIFFLHKDTTPEEDEEDKKARDARRRRRKRRRDREAGIILEDDSDDEKNDDEDEDDDWDDDESSDEEPEGGEGPPLVYVLNLVYTKKDKSVKRGAIVKSMAICTRHPFLHIYKVGSASSLPASSAVCTKSLPSLYCCSLSKSISNLLSRRPFPCCSMPSIVWTSPSCPS